MSLIIKKKPLNTLVNTSLLLTLFSPLSSFAIEKYDPDFFPVGDFFVIPSVSINERYNDNVFLQDDNEKSSLISIINPKVRVAYEGENSLTAFDIDLKKGFFHSTSNDNYFDKEIGLSTQALLTDKLEYDASIGYEQGHDSRGIGLQDGLDAFEFSSPHEYDALKAQFKAQYGSKARGGAQLTGEVIFEDKKYTNHRVATRELDRDTVGGTVGLAYKLAPATSVLIEGAVRKINYDQAALDSKEYKGLIGLRWESTFQTTGFMKVGVERKQFSDSINSDSSEPAWEVGLDWAPLSYSTVLLRTAKGFSEGEGTGSFSNTETLSIEWQHDWYEHIGTRIKFEHANDAFGEDNRDEDTDSVFLAADYQFNPWLLITMDYSYAKRRSNTEGLDYKNNIYSLDFKLNF